MIRRALCMLAMMFCACCQPAFSSFQTQGVVPPLSFALFCARYPEDCQQHRDLRITDFRSRTQRWRELNQINSIVNFSIVPKTPSASRTAYDWQIFLLREAAETMLLQSAICCCEPAGRVPLFCWPRSVFAQPENTTLFCSYEKEELFLFSTI